MKRNNDVAEMDVSDSKTTTVKRHKKKMAGDVYTAKDTNQIESNHETEIINAISSLCMSDYTCQWISADVATVYADLHITTNDCHTLTSDSTQSELNLSTVEYSSGEEEFYGDDEASVINSVSE